MFDSVQLKGYVMGRSLAERPKAYMNTAQAASMLKVSKKTIWSWCKDGYLPAIRKNKLGAHGFEYQIEIDEVVKAWHKIKMYGTIR